MHFDPSFTAPSVALLSLQPSQTAQPFQYPCFDWDIAVHHGTVDQKAPGFLALQQHHHSSWGSIVRFLEHVQKLLKDHTVPLATINGQKLAQIASDFDFNENPTKSDILSVIKNQSAVEKLLNRPGQRRRGQGGTAVAAAAIPRRWWCHGAALGSGQQQQWAAGVLGASWRSWNHLARVRNALREARHRHLENFYSRAKVCGATSCYCSASFLNISCFSACKKLFPFFSPFNHPLVRGSYFILHQQFSLCGCKICRSVSGENVPSLWLQWFCQKINVLTALP